MKDSNPQIDTVVSRIVSYQLLSAFSMSAPLATRDKEMFSQLNLPSILCGTGQLRAAHAVITLPVSARTVPTRGPFVPFYDVTVVHDPLPTEFSFPFNFDVISDVPPAILLEPFMKNQM